MMCSWLTSLFEYWQRERRAVFCSLCITITFDLVYFPKFAENVSNRVYRIASNKRPGAYLK